ncbi:MAG TPA: DUF167 domain-containing protein [Terriglobales bacterium]|jgi:uncharacterized protein (TIGR00251 family)|nr:DUF167 domain-containing protein [Terriglobales bacterium]
MRLGVTVKPNSRVSSVEERDGEYFVRLDAPAREGRANGRLVEVLAAHFGVPKTRVIIHSGAHSRKKIVDILI